MNPKIASVDDKLLSIRGLAERWSLDPKSIHNAINRATEEHPFPLPILRILSGSIRFRLLDVQAYEGAAASNELAQTMRAKRAFRLLKPAEKAKALAGKERPSFT